METTVEPVESPKGRMAPVVRIVIAILVVCLASLFLPSSKTTRVRKAKAMLDTEYQAPAPNDLADLMAADLISNGKFVKPAGKEQTFIYIFAPNPKDTAVTQYFNEIDSINNYYSRSNPLKTFTLFAPDPACAGWTLISKVWIAKSLLKQPTNELRNLGQTLGYGGSGSSLARLKGIWGAVPAAVQANAESILEANRKVASKFKESHRFFLDGNGRTFEISMHENIYEFMNYYDEAYPSPQAVR